MPSITPAIGALLLLEVISAHRRAVTVRAERERLLQGQFDRQTRLAALRKQKEELQEALLLLKPTPPAAQPLVDIKNRKRVRRGDSEGEAFATAKKAKKAHVIQPQRRLTRSESKKGGTPLDGML
ncbi:hypothetical protein B0H11DRAFT_1985725 [Mycena galericulata]|nr:hypothetical protein B0H11DRAFT_1985725 [Mycena galericulata]